MEPNSLLCLSRLWQFWSYPNESGSTNKLEPTQSNMKTSSLLLAPKKRNTSRFQKKYKNNEQIQSILKTLHTYIVDVL